MNQCLIFCGYDEFCKAVDYDMEEKICTLFYGYPSGSIFKGKNLKEQQFLLFFNFGIKNRKKFDGSIFFVMVKKMCKFGVTLFYF